MPIVNKCFISVKIQNTFSHWMYPEKNADISKVIPSHFLFESNLLDCLQYHLMKSRAGKREIHFSLQRNPILCAEKSRNKHPHRLHIPSHPLLHIFNIARMRNLDSIAVPLSNPHYSQIQKQWDNQACPARCSTFFLDAINEAWRIVHVI